MTFDFLTDQEKADIQRFIGDKKMLEAVRRVVLYDLNEAGVIKKGATFNPARNSAFALVADRGDGVSNEQLGEVVRAQWEGINYLEVAFINMEKLVEEMKQPEKVAEKNPAR